MLLEFSKLKCLEREFNELNLSMNLRWGFLIIICLFCSCALDKKQKQADEEFINCINYTNPELIPSLEAYEKELMLQFNLDTNTNGFYNLVQEICSSTDSILKGKNYFLLDDNAMIDMTLCFNLNHKKGYLINENDRFKMLWKYFVLGDSLIGSNVQQSAKELLLNFSKEDFERPFRKYTTLIMLSCLVDYFEPTIPIRIIGNQIFVRDSLILEDLVTAVFQEKEELLKKYPLESIVASIKADKECNMIIIDKVENALRENDVLRVSFSAVSQQ